VVPRVTYSSIINHWISSHIASSMQDAMKIASLHYCFNSIRMCYTWLHCSVSCTWWIIVVIILGSTYWLPYHNVSFIIGSCFIDDGDHYVANSSNFDKLKFVKVLNKLGVVRIVANTYETPISRLTNCLTLDYNSFALNISNMVAFTMVVVNTIWCYLCVFWKSFCQYSKRNNWNHPCVERHHC